MTERRPRVPPTTPDLTPQLTESAHREAGEWRDHEHVAPAIQTEAEKLVEQTGSPELAKQAIEAVAGQRASAESQVDDFAHRLGFLSRLDMLSVSLSLAAPDGTSWWATDVGQEGWVLWNERDFTARQRFPTIEACQQYLESSRMAERPAGSLAASDRE